MSINKKILYICWIPCLLAFHMIQVNAAYIDPSVMTYAIQAIAGIVITVSTFFGMYMTRISKKLKKRNIRAEGDSLVFHDPETGEDIRTAEVIKKPEETVSRKLNPFVTSVILGFAISFMLVIYEPLEIYFTNVDSFRYDFSEIFKYLILLLIILFCLAAVIFLISYLLSKKLHFAFLYLAFSLFIAMYIQGTILIADLPPTDGTVVDWTQYGAQNLQSTVLFVSVFVICFVLLIVLKKERYQRLIRFFSLGITLMLATTLVVNCVKNDGLKKKINLQMTYKDMDLYSSNQNFIFLIVDAVDSGAFNELLNTKKPEYKENFEDFVYYPDTLSGYPYTSSSIPFMVSGIWFENDGSFGEYVTKAMTDSPLFAQLRKRNFIRSFYDNDIVVNDPSFFEFSNIYESSSGIENPKEFMLNELRLAFYMFMPYQLKKYEPYVMHNLMAQESYMAFNWEDTWFYHFYDNREIKLTDQPRFLFIHTEGAHVPYRYDEYLNVYHSYENPTYEGNVMGTMTMINHYLQVLKDAGVYDDSAIIVASDHGYNGEDAFGRQNPFLMIKGMNEHHAFEISDKPISHADLLDAYNQLMDKKSGYGVFPDISENEKRTRKYMFHYYWMEEIVEYILEDGVASDTSALKETGNRYPAD